MAKAFFSVEWYIQAVDSQLKLRSPSRRLSIRRDHDRDTERGFYLRGCIHPTVLRGVCRGAKMANGSRILRVIQCLPISHGN